MANCGIYLIYHSCLIWSVCPKGIAECISNPLREVPISLVGFVLGLQFYKILSCFLRRAGEIMLRILNITRYYDGKWLTKQFTTVAIAARESFVFFMS